MCAVQIGDDGMGCPPGFPGTQDQHFSALQIKTVFYDQVFQAEILSVIAGELSLFIDDGVDRTEPAGLSADLVEQGEDCPPAGTCHIDSPEIPGPYEGVRLFGTQVLNFIGNQTCFLIDHFREAVRKTFSY